MPDAARTFTTRPATGADCAQIAHLYAHYVLTHTSTFELEPPDEREIHARWDAIQAAGYPFRVALSGGRIGGFCYVGPYRARPAYRFTAENSIYVAPEQQRCGIGVALMRECLELAAARGIREVIAVIGDSANVASIELHRRLGFVPTGTLTNVGYKFGRWLDTVLMQWTAPGTTGTGIAGKGAPHG